MGAVPFLSVVVPTRERADTLRSCLATIVSQDYDHFDVVVSDNASADDTRAVIESFRDSRIRYFNPGRRLGMTRNWEFALSHVRKGYVTFIGDDDGLMPHALKDAAALLTQERVEALVWKKVNYCWPSHPEPVFRNLALLPLDNKLFRCQTRRVLHDCINFWTPYYYLPCVYNSFVHLDAVQRVTARSGAFFHSITPDAYSGFALASAIGEYRFMSRPLSVNGASGHSNGAGTDRMLEGQEESSTGRFFSEIDIPLHSRLPVAVAGSLTLSVLEAILQANDHCYSGRLPVDMAHGFSRVVREASYSVPRRYETIVAALRAIAARTGDSELVESAIRKYPPRPAVPEPPRRGLSMDQLICDVSEFGVTDVEGAARVSAAILGPYQRPSTTRDYRGMAKLASRGLRLIHQRVASWVWE